MSLASEKVDPEVVTSTDFTVLTQRMRGLSRRRRAHDAELQPAAVAFAAAAPPPKEIMTLAEAAEYCSVSIPTFKKWPIPRRKEGNIVRVRKADIDTFFSAESPAAQVEVSSAS